MTRVRTLPELTEAATKALVKELGYADAVRFLRTVRGGKGDYAKDRRSLLKGLTADRIVAEATRIQNESRSPRRRRSA
jgi:hypothetical protein